MKRTVNSQPKRDLDSIQLEPGEILKKPRYSLENSELVERIDHSRCVILIIFFSLLEI
jgi:hypothetical protein